MGGDNVLFKHWYFLGVKEKALHVTPKNRILVPLRDSFQNFRRLPPFFFYGNSTQGSNHA